MRGRLWICAAIGLAAIAGCHRNSAVTAEDLPQFTNKLAAGSTGDTMSQLAQQYSIPLYPGAVPDTSHFTATANSGTRVFLAYTTADSTDRVVNFYKGNMNVSASTSGAVTVLSGTTKNGSDVTIDVGQKMDGTGTTFSIIINPQAGPTSDTVAATPPPTQDTQVAATQTPPTAASKDMTDSTTNTDTTTYYVPTANSADDSNTASDDSQDQQSGDSSTTGQQSGDQSNGNDQQNQNQNQSTGGGSDQQTQDNGTPPGS